MGVATAIAAVGAATAVYGAVKSNSAGQDAAAAQGSIAQQQLAQAQKAAAFAVPTSDELQTLSNQVNLYNNAYTQSQSQLSTLQKQITDTYGSNIIEQGQQLHEELTGQNSVIVQQAQDQASRQRDAYQQQLISKLGPGAMSSSAGIQAMATFDRTTAQSIAQLQENSINNAVTRLGGLQGSQSTAVQSINSINGSLSGMLNSIQGTQNAFQTRQANAQMGVTQYSGADQIQNLQSAKTSAQFGNNIANIGGQLVGAGIGAASKSSESPEPNPNPGGITNTPFQAGTQGIFGGGNMSYTPFEGTVSNNNLIGNQLNGNANWG